MEQTPLTKKQVIEEIETYLNATEMKYEAIQKTSNKIYNRTTRIIKTVFFSIGLLIVINSYFMYDFGKGIVSMLSSMNEMYTHFGNMADQVHGINKSVEKMTTHIEVLPIMAESIDSMNHTVYNMNMNVQSMQGEVNFMAYDVDSINHNITDMSSNFNQVNKDMQNLGNDVNQMSRIIPF